LTTDEDNLRVMMNEEEHEQKMKTLLQEGPYKVLENNPLNKIIKQINDGIKKKTTNKNKDTINSGSSHFTED